MNEYITTVSLEPEELIFIMKYRRKDNTIHIKHTKKLMYYQQSIWLSLERKGILRFINTGILICTVLGLQVLKQIPFSKEFDQDEMYYINLLI